MPNLSRARLAMDILSFERERQFLAFMRANYLHLFPQLGDQSQFNRRARASRLVVEEWRRAWCAQLGATDETFFLLDTKPVALISDTRREQCRDFRLTAS